MSVLFPNSAVKALNLKEVEHFEYDNDNDNDSDDVEDVSIHGVTVNRSPP
jgi:hypothetical protein